MFSHQAHRCWIPLKFRKCCLLASCRPQPAKFHDKRRAALNTRGHLCDNVRQYGSKSHFNRFVDEIVKWYDELTGMDEVRRAQARVLEEEANFRATQDARRDILAQLNDLQRKLKKVHAELDMTTRGEDKYISLVTLEHKLLQEEKAVTEKFTLAEAKERESFAMLSNSVKFSHEQERAQRERTKYWGVFGSMLGTILGIFGTSINNHFKMKELRELIKNNSNASVFSGLKNLLNEDNSLKVLNRIDQTLTKGMSDSERNQKIVHNLLNDLQDRLVNVETRLNAVDLNKKFLSSQAATNHDMTEAVQNRLNFTNMVLIAVTILTILIPTFTRSS